MRQRAKFFYAVLLLAGFVVGFLYSSSEVFGQFLVAPASDHGKVGDTRPSPSSDEEDREGGEEGLVFYLQFMQALLVVFGIMVTVALGFFGFLGVSAERRHGRELEAMRDDIALAKQELEMRSDNAEERLSRNLLKSIQIEVREGLKIVFAEQYEKEIYRFASSYTQEVLLQAPELRGLFLARLRRLASSVQQALEPCCGEEVSREVAEALKRAMQDWYTLGLLASSDPEHLETGLHHARANPIPESRKRLKLLRERWKDHPGLVPLINRALAALEERKTK